MFSLSLCSTLLPMPPPPPEKEEIGTEIKKKVESYEGFNIVASNLQPHLCVFIIKPIFCVVCLS